jgi:hypothetical protein
MMNRFQNLLFRVNLRRYTLLISAAAQNFLCMQLAAAQAGAYTRPLLGST